MSTEAKLRVAAVGDLHVREVPADPYRELFERASAEADVLVLCGDLTHFGAPAEAETLARDLQHLTIPAVAVLGNHDHEGGQVTEVKRILRDKLVFIDEKRFELHDTLFVGVKGFGGGFETHMLSSFGEAAIKHFVSEAVEESMRLENLLKDSSAAHCVVALHYAPIAETVEGESPALYPFLGCSRLAEVIDRYPVSVVFHGHAHHGRHEGRTRAGIPVFNCSESLLKQSGSAEPFTLFQIDGR